MQGLKGTHHLRSLSLLASIGLFQKDNKNIAWYFMPYGKNLPRSIAGTCLLARAGGNEKVLYAIWQEGLRAHAVGKGSGQCNSTSYLMPLCLLLFQENAYPFSY
jgi:hypothetical protein